MLAKEIINHFFNFGSFQSYEFFGVHPLTKTKEGKKLSGFVFRLYAPNATDVFVVGDFNQWRAKDNPMEKVHDWGIYEVFVPTAKFGDKYKYQFKNTYGIVVQKADPYAFESEVRPLTASVISTYQGFQWHDQSYLANRNRNFDRPMAIYEVHLGSWKKPEKKEFFSYEEMADQLIPYVLDHGFTHIELMPLSQHPFDGSWGYQTTGFHSVDSRYGSLKGLMTFVDRCHQVGIGVILDFVVVHFANDGFGLHEFDGSKLYEYFDPRRTFSQWGSPQFDLSKPVVRSMLFSSINYFISMFHLDGIRIDAVSNIVYWDGDTQQGENSGGIAFLRDLNSFIHTYHPTVMVIAEDSSAFGGVTRPVEAGGLGFDYKWDMGWMNDTLKYYAVDFVYKFYDHHKLTFSMHYFYSDNFMLPLSHDEVVHGKGTILNKMWGNYDEKFALLRNLYTYQWMHPGKKLIFMGNEIASFDEWSEKKALSWFFTQYPKHDSIRTLFKDLNRIYKQEPSLHIEEHNPARFRWLMVDNRQDNIYVFERKVNHSTIIIVLNMKGNYYNDYDIGVFEPGTYQEILNSDNEIYSGWNRINKLPLVTKQQTGPEGKPFTLSLTIGSFAAIVLKRISEDNR
jgi:1,4-alpha-glucan branching enzyme